MKLCPNCHNPADDAVVFCPHCGSKFEADPAPAPQQPVPPISQMPPRPTPPPYAYVPPADPFDHTSDFTAEDISENKVVSMLVYLLGIVGIIVALLAGKDSAYASFHVRQAMKFTVLTTLCTIATVVLAWTIIVPIAGAIASTALLVCRVISFTQVCQGKAVEPYIVRSLSFLN